MHLQSRILLIEWQLCQLSIRKFLRGRVQHHRVRPEQQHYIHAVHVTNSVSLQSRILFCGRCVYCLSEG